MFWRVSTFTQLSPIEAILDKEDLTLEELLDEEDLIQECKAANPRLSQFLSKRSVIEQLLRYLSETPEDDVHFKYSYTACEIFVCELDDVLHALIKDDSLMAQLFSLLDQPAPLNATLAGYFGRVVGSLLVKRAPEMHRYLQAHAEILERLVAHVDTTSTVEVLLRLIGADDAGGGAASGHADWLGDAGLMDALLARLVAPPAATSRAATTQRAAQANIGNVLVAVAHAQVSPMIEQLVRPGYLAGMLDAAAAPRSPVLRPVLAVCAALLDPKAPPMQPVTAPLNFGLMPALESPPEPNRGTVRAAAAEIVRYLPAFTALLARDADAAPPTPAAAVSPLRGGGGAPQPAAAAQEQPYGTLSPPLGRQRLAVVELGKALLSTCEPLALRAIMATRFVHHVLRLVQAYPLNSILHCSALEILALLVASLSAAGSGGSSGAVDGGGDGGGEGGGGLAAADSSRPAPLAPIGEGADEDGSSSSSSSGGGDGLGDGGGTEGAAAERQGYINAEPVAKLHQQHERNGVTAAAGSGGGPEWQSGVSEGANLGAAGPRCRGPSGDGKNGNGAAGTNDGAAGVHDDDDVVPDVAEWLLDDLGLVEWLLSLPVMATSEFLKPRAPVGRVPLPAAYHGHITQLAQKLEAVEHGLVRSALDLDGRWTTFRDGALAQRSALEARDAWSVALPAAAAIGIGDEDDDVGGGTSGVGDEALPAVPEYGDTYGDEAFAEPGDYFSSPLGGGYAGASRYDGAGDDDDEDDGGDAGVGGYDSAGLAAAGLPGDGDVPPAAAILGPRSHSIPGGAAGDGGSSSSDEDEDPADARTAAPATRARRSAGARSPDGNEAGGEDEAEGDGEGEGGEEGDGGGRAEGQPRPGSAASAGGLAGALAAVGLASEASGVDDEDDDVVLQDAGEAPAAPATSVPVPSRPFDSAAGVDEAMVGGVRAPGGLAGLQPGEAAEEEGADSSSRGGGGAITGQQRAEGGLSAGCAVDGVSGEAGGSGASATATGQAGSNVGWWKLPETSMADTDLPPPPPPPPPPPRLAQHEAGS